MNCNKINKTNRETKVNLSQRLPSAMQNFSDHKHTVSYQLEGEPREKIYELEEQVFKAFYFLNDAMVSNKIPLRFFAEYLSMVKNVVEEMDRDIIALCDEIEEVMDVL